LDIAPQVCITRDNTQVQVDGVLYYQITDAARASYGTSNYLAAITMLAQTALRSECGKRDLDKLLEDRDAINRTVVFALDEASPNWGVKVLRYEIKDITPPQQVLAAMQKQITAEREKRALIAQSEGKKQEENQSRRRQDDRRHPRVGRHPASRYQQRAGWKPRHCCWSPMQRQNPLRWSPPRSRARAASRRHLKVAERFVEAFGNIAKQGNTMILPATPPISPGWLLLRCRW